MKVEVRAEGVHVSQPLREFIERKLRFALGRFGQRIHGVRVRLTDVNGPKNGRDIQCHIQTNLSPGGVLKIEELREDPFSAVARAADRVSRRVARHMKRVHDRRQGRLR